MLSHYWTNAHPVNLDMAQGNSVPAGQISHLSFGPALPPTLAAVLAFRLL